MHFRRFERLVEDAVAIIPEAFQEYLDNVVFVVEPHADEETLTAMGIASPDDLLGLYQGDPLTDRGADAWGMLPDRILLYQRAIELYAEDYGQPVVEVIRDTILHEVGHFFGLSEEDLERVGLD